jgi:spore coat polysaccharide biosynthesis protein SpsF (cytidylyltransferase family)/aryl-alcohol dehydrogenase-like predicted oxidoreductase
MKTVAIVQARTGSTRLPGKILADIAGKPLIQRVLERTRQAALLDEVCLATTLSPADDPLADLARALGFTLFRGSEQDVLDRYYQAALTLGAETVVRVTGDCPFVDPGLIDACVRSRRETGCDYFSNAYPDASYPDGLDVEVFTFAALERAWREAALPSEREHVCPYIWKNPGTFRLAGLRNERDLSHLRWTVDEPRDLEFARALYALLPDPDGRFGMGEVLALLEASPGLAEINSGIQRNAGYLASSAADPGGSDESAPDTGRLVLGTAQLGMAYGVVNASGQPDRATARAIVETAWSLGVREFDTAQSYGDSEEVLGRALKDLGLSGQARIVTKPHPDTDHLDPEALARSVERSAAALGQAGFGLLLHREELLDLWERGLGDSLQNIVCAGLASRVGVSVYSPGRALQALRLDGISMVQVPANILDRRFERAGVFDLAAGLGKTVYVRSVYLQGLLQGLRPGDVPGPMRFAEPVLRDFRALAARAGVAPGRLALWYVKRAYPKAKIVFGAELPAQVRQNVADWSAQLPQALLDEARGLFAEVDERILNPCLWPR